MNIYVRSGRPLLEVSTGLLIDGCSSATNRTDKVKPVSAARKRRQANCESDCDGIPDNTLKEICKYDCVAASDSGIEESVSS